jgi:dCTP deaminase
MKHSWKRELLFDRCTQCGYRLSARDALLNPHILDEECKPVTKTTKSPGVGIDMIPWSVLSSPLICTDGKERKLYGPGRLPDWAIREFITITNFVDYDQCPKGVVSYGLSSAGYDMRVGSHFKVFTNAWCEKVSPHNISDKCFQTRVVGACFTGPGGERATHDWDEGKPSPSREGQLMYSCKRCPAWTHFLREVEDAGSILIPPNCFALAETTEHISIPRNVMCICLGKSTYARCGINMNFTPFEPGWRGIVTVEIINATPCPVEIFAGQGIGQCLFDLMAGEPERAYSDKTNAKYQDQTGLTLPTVK